MKTLCFLALRSAWNRRSTLALMCLALTLSCVLLLALAHVRVAARASFTGAVSGVDLVVGPRENPVSLVLYAIFHLGAARRNIAWESYEDIARRPEVAWSVPLSLGDSHRGFPVLGTSADFFVHYRHGDRQPLRFVQGGNLRELFDAVIGAEVARALRYRRGERITLRHGDGRLPGLDHADKPFTVSGILAPTGTPVDRTVFVSLAAIEAIHLDWQGGRPLPGISIPADQVRKFDLKPKTLTAFLVGLKQRAAVFRLQREIDAQPGEALSAVPPGVALDELWQMLGAVDALLTGISWLTLGICLAGAAAVTLAGQNERRREIAILRAAGAQRHHIAILLLLESGMIALLSIASAFCIVRLAAFVLHAQATRWGLAFPSLAAAIPAAEWRLMAEMLGAMLCVTLLPLVRAYRRSLSDGLIPRL
ncbi:MAG: ABC transporter permease [Azoarcus sp.]|jgi:putative ABC transport system permease protein|nr:ABC transporter permease [Azoarcus sp.]